MFFQIVKSKGAETIFRGGERQHGHREQPLHRREERLQGLDRRLRRQNCRRRQQLRRRQRHRRSKKVIQVSMQ